MLARAELFAFQPGLAPAQPPLPAPPPAHPVSIAAAAAAQERRDGAAALRANLAFLDDQAAAAQLDQNELLRKGRRRSAANREYNRKAAAAAVAAAAPGLLPPPQRQQLLRRAIPPAAGPRSAADAEPRWPTGGGGLLHFHPLRNRWVLNTEFPAAGLLLDAAGLEERHQSFLRGAYTVDAPEPVANGWPHFSNGRGGHIYSTAGQDTCWGLNLGYSPSHCVGVAIMCVALGCTADSAAPTMHHPHSLPALQLSYRRSLPK